MVKFTKGTKVEITETEFGKLAQPEIAVVFEDFGQTHINIKRTNGQIHAVPRSSVTKAAQ